MERRKYNIPLWFIAIIDVLLVIVSYFLAFLLRFQGDLPVINITPFYKLIAFITVATLVLFEILDLYKRDWKGLNRDIRTIAVALFFVFLLTATATYWIRGFAFPRSTLILGLLLQVLLISAWRHGCWKLDNLLHGSREVVVFGDPNDSEVLDKIKSAGEGCFRIKEIIPPEKFNPRARELQNADGFVVLPSFPEEQKKELLSLSLERKKVLLLVPRSHEIILSNAEIMQIDDLPVLKLNNISPSPGLAFVKRVIDVAVAGVLLLVSSPLMAVIALAIKLTSPGPVFYLQERVGKDEKTFLLCKFRTMVENAEATTGPVLAARNDPRITPVGRILRATRLDELPQLWNVLKGDMSLVGPRPERPVFVERFKKEIPGYSYRHLVKPGITGFAQVAGRYTTSAADKLKYDLFYITNYSLFDDLKILMKTIPVVINREAADGCSPTDKSHSRSVSAS